MQLQNAYKGLKKLNFGLILLAFGALYALVLQLVLFIKGSAMITAENAALLTIIQGIFALGILVLGLGGLFLMFIGVLSAKKDEERFQYALYAILAGILLSILDNSLKGLSPAFQISLRVLSVIRLILMFRFILSGVESLAEKVNDSVIRNYAHKTWWKTLLILAVVAVSHPFLVLLENGTLTGILRVIGFVLNIAAYTLLTSVVGLAAKMLKD